MCGRIVASLLVCAVVALPPVGASAQQQLPISVTHPPPDSIQATEIVISATSPGSSPVRIALKPDASGTTKAAVNLPDGDWRINVTLNTRLTYDDGDGLSRPIRATHTTAGPVRAGSGPLNVFLGPDAFGACQGGPRIKALWLDALDGQIRDVLQGMMIKVPSGTPATAEEEIEEARRAEEDAERLELQAAALESGFGATEDVTPIELRERAAILRQNAEVSRRNADRIRADNKRLEELRGLRDRISAGARGCPIGNREVGRVRIGESVSSLPRDRTKSSYQFFANVSAISGGTSNAGLGGTVTVPRFGGSAHHVFGIDAVETQTPFTPRALEIQLYGATGDVQKSLGARGPSPTPWIFLQGQGSQQSVPGFVPVSGHAISVTIENVGADVILHGPEHQLGSGPVTVTPLALVGGEYRSRKRALTTNFASIGFSNLDQRQETETSVSAGLGFDVTVPFTPTLSGFARALVRARFGFVDADGLYTFSQPLGIGSGSVATRVSTTMLTPETTFVIGFTHQPTDRLKFDVSAWLKHGAWPELTHRIGAPSQIVADYRTEIGGRVGLLILLQPSPSLPIE